MTAVLLNACTSLQGVVDAQLLAVRGIAIGSSRSAVLDAFGSPAHVETGHDDIMGMGAWERLTYDGLMVEVIRPEEDGRALEEPYAATIEITGPEWVTKSGLHVGSSRADVIRVLGTPDRAEGETYFYYTERFDGHVRVELREGIVRRIEVDEDWT